jgi:hypothetical protein
MLALRFLSRRSTIVKVGVREISKDPACSARLTPFPLPVPHPHRPRHSTGDSPKPLEALQLKVEYSSQGSPLLHLVNPTTLSED